MQEDITLLDALYSQRAIRYFTDEPVPDETVHRLIEAATKAPSGGNRQGWKFLVIRDQAAKNIIADYYEKSWELAYGSENPNPPDIQSHVRRSADHLARHMADVPVLIMACIEHDGEPSSMGRGGSIFPAVQNLLVGRSGTRTRKLSHQPAQAVRGRNQGASRHPPKRRDRCPAAHRIPREQRQVRTYDTRSRRGSYIQGTLGASLVTCASVILCPFQHPLCEVLSNVLRVSDLRAEGPNHIRHHQPAPAP